MPYIGNTPADKFLTLAKQNFSTSATTSYTLDSAVSSTQDIALFINNVRQSPVDAYTVSGTALTLTSATAGTDEMYCVFLGKTVGTVSPASNSVTTAMIQANAVTGAKLNTDVISAQTALGAAPADTDELLVSDAGVLKRVDYSYLKGGDNTPAFMAVMGSDDSLANSTFTKATFDTEVFDTDSAFASNKFTVPSGEGGKYLFVSHILCYDIDDTNRVEGRIYKNGANSGGASTGSQTVRWYSGGANFQMDMTFTTILDLSATDYIELYVMQTNGDTQTLYRDTWFAGYKLNGV